MEQNLEEIKVNVANFNRKITNFAIFLQNYNAERDFAIIEKRKKDVDAHFF